jgi:hypothetical protein
MAYVFKELALRSIAPVDELITRPAGVDVNNPPPAPVTVGVGSAPVWQYVGEE